MAKIIFEGKTIEIGKTPIESFKKLGINFGCQGGNYGLCKIKVLKGMKNINSKTKFKENFPLEDNERLSFHCYKINGGIKIKNA